MAAAVRDADSQTEENVMILRLSNLDDLQQDVDNLSLLAKTQIAFVLGNSERANIREQSLAQMRSRSLEELLAIDPSSWVMQNNLVLLSFCLGIKGQESSKMDFKKPNFQIEKPSDIYQIIKATESVMALSTPVCVLPFHFREVILVYSLTRSRMALSLFACGSPSGSYQAVKGWLGGLVKDEDNTKLHKGDLLSVFDNNQVMQRRWQISLGNVSRASTITMVVYFKIEDFPEKCLQFKEQFSPSEWMWQNLPDNALEQLLGQEKRARKYLYDHHLYRWLTAIISEVAAEQTHDGDSNEWTDFIDKTIADQKYVKEHKKCVNCGEEMAKAHVKCRSCKMTTREARLLKSQHVPTNQPSTSSASSAKRRKLSKEVRVSVSKESDSKYRLSYSDVQQADSAAHPYSYLGNNHPKVPPAVSVGSPIFVNPCSYDALSVVFQNIGKSAGLKKYGGEREWIAIMCDGLPYILGMRLIETLLRCSTCDELFRDPTLIEKHKREGHTSFVKEFDWILLQPGPGHIEMNMLKGVVKLNWDVFWESMVELFNFKTETAKNSARNVSDHHKGFTLARIARDGITKELVLPYIRHTLDAKEELSAAKFIKFSRMMVQNPNYGYMYNFIVELMDPIFAYRAGLRSGQVKLADSARDLFAKMWSARDHPMYRHLEVYDKIVDMCMPSEVRNLLHSTRSFNLSGVDYTGEGGDFKLEEINKEVQHWLPGVPTDNDWIVACNNYNDLGILRDRTFQQMALKDPKDKKAKPPSDIRQQVNAFRALIRGKEYFSNYDQPGTHTSLAGKPLDGDLINFVELATNNRRVFVEKFVEEGKRGNLGKPIPLDEKRIFVTPAERKDSEDVKKMTINDIKIKIQSTIDTIPDEEMQQNFLLEYAQFSSSKKSKLIEFYGLIKEYIELYDIYDTNEGGTIPVDFFDDDYEGEDIQG